MRLQTIGMNLITKSSILYSSSPGGVVEGYINVINDYDNQTVDILWGFGTYDSGVGSFSIAGYLITENYVFYGLTSTHYTTGTFSTPEAPGTWDLIGILADDIYFEDNNLVVVGQHGSGFVEENGWTISSVTELSIVGVGVQ